MSTTSTKYIDIILRNQQAIQGFQRTTKEIDRMGKSATETSAKLNKGFGGHQIQNVSYQIQDFAVQVSGGTSAMRAFGQQAPQLLSAFGPIGTILGTVTAIAAGFAGALLTTKEEAADAADELATFKESLDRLNSDSVKSLGEKITGITESLGKWQELARQGAVAAIGQEIKDTQVELRNYLQTLNDVGDAQTSDKLKNLPRSFQSSRYIRDQAEALTRVDKLMKEFGITSRAVAVNLDKTFSEFERGKLDAEELAASLRDMATTGNTIDDGALQKVLDLVVKIIEGQSKVEELLKPKKATVQDLTGVDELLGSISSKIITVDAQVSNGSAWAWAEDAKTDLTGVDDLLEDISAKIRAIENLPSAFKGPSFDPKSLEDVGVSFDDTTEKAKTFGDEVAKLSDQWAMSFSDDLVSSLRTGENAFKSFANTVIDQLAKIALQAALTPFFESFGNWVGGGTFAPNPTTRAITIPGTKTLEGGSVAGRMVPSVSGLSSSARSSQPTVNVYNNNAGDNDVSVRTSNDGATIDVMIERKVRGMVSSGALDAPMRQSYGIARRSM